MTEQSLADLQRCVQMLIDSQPVYMQGTLKWMWQIANANPLENYMVERAWVNHCRFLAMLADHHDFLEPVLSSLPDSGISVSRTDPTGAIPGLVWGDLNSPELAPYLQELHELESALWDLLPNIPESDSESINFGDMKDCITPHR
ncbi:hypothetical protein HCI55_00030 [Escherichia coli]|nr:hypothetical protein [Escherichia coli]